jgi:hypothetical protein
MGLGGNSINTWEEITQTFLKKYQDYCKAKDVREEIFKMTQEDDVSLEDYIEKFQYNLQRSKQNKLEPETLHTILLTGIRDDYINVLNLMGAGDISR